MVKRAYIIGVEAESISKQLECESVICENMKKAVEKATEDSSLGDVVLLAPAASSFDQYDNFEHRGEDFVLQVERVIKGAKKSKTVWYGTDGIWLLIYNKVTLVFLKKISKLNL